MKTKNTKHTPGPWRSCRVPNGAMAIYAGPFIHRSAKDEVVAILCHEFGNEEANSRLIAAAQELLEAVKLLISPKGTTFMAAVKKARAAISKAEGGA